MTSEFNERLTISPTEKTQVWIIGTREQVLHLINELCRLVLGGDIPEIVPVSI